MLKEFKYFIYIITIIIVLVYTGKYYFSDINKKYSYRTSQLIDNKINNYSKKLKSLQSDTDNIVEYLENNQSKDKKKYNFWDLLENNEK